MVKIARIVNHFFHSNTYILSVEGLDYVWLVDCGDYWRVKRKLKGKSVKGVLISHTHADHIYGVNKLIEDFPNVLIVTNDFGKNALYDPKLNLTKYHENVPDFLLSQSAIISVLGEGNRIELFPEIIAEVMETFGHDRSCLSYIIGNYLFTGDSYIPGVKLTAKFPNSNKKDALIQYNRLKEMEGQYIICPGHGNIKKIRR